MIDMLVSLGFAGVVITAYAACANAFVFFAHINPR